ncbi:MAG: hypothetical protein J4F44_06775 [Acidimicrobiia bacterium]|nr:hypothetical protein [Acidimicrobiia bacterium]
MTEPGFTERRSRLGADRVAMFLMVAGFAAFGVLMSLMLIRSGSLEGQIRRCAADFGASPSLVEQVRRDPSMGLSWADGRGWYAVEVGRENSGTVGDVWDWTELDAVNCEAPFD